MYKFINRSAPINPADPAKKPRSSAMDLPRTVHSVLMRLSESSSAVFNLVMSTTSMEGHQRGISADIRCDGATRLMEITASVCSSSSHIAVAGYQQLTVTWPTERDADIG